MLATTVDNETFQLIIACLQAAPNFEFGRVFAFHYFNRSFLDLPWHDVPLFKKTCQRLQASNTLKTLTCYRNSSTEHTVHVYEVNILRYNVR